MSRSKYLTISESRDGNACVVSVSGRIDSTNAEDLIARINALLAAGEKNLVVDLGEVLYLTSAAFRALLVASDEAQRNTASLVLCRVLGQVRELFEMGGLLDAFTIHDSKEEALSKLS